MCNVFFLLCFVQINVFITDDAEPGQCGAVCELSGGDG